MRDGNFVHCTQTRPYGLQLCTRSRRKAPVQADDRRAPRRRRSVQNDGPAAARTAEHRLDGRGHEAFARKVTSSILADLLAFLRASPTPYHAVASASARLVAAGFAALDERDSWAELPPGRYFTAHGDSALVAFAIPEGGVRGFRIVGAHTDSPNLRLKPKAEYTKEGYAQLGVEVYGGVLLNSWLDRDLSLAGRALVREESGDERRLVTRLVDFERPIARVAQLAIHLDREVTEKGLVLNKQEHLAPILSLSPQDGGDVEALAAERLGVDRGRIASLDLMLYDTLAPSLGGLRDEFIFSARLDNLAMCHASITALAEVFAAGDARPLPSGLVPVVALFDHEEVGSHSHTGAASALLPRVLERVAAATSRGRDEYHRVLASSLCVSADMAHAVHPNYADRHEAHHRPMMNGGPVIKVNAQQRYATSARTAALFEEICRSVDVPVQHYAHRTDLPCGSTIGPITATLLGIPTVDVGNAMLSMHSAREMAGAKDPERMVRALAAFFTAART